jgi:hypothetical protein
MKTWLLSLIIKKIHNGILLSYKEGGNCIICRKMGGTRGQHVKRNNPYGERQIPHVVSHLQNLVLRNE